MKFLAKYNRLLFAFFVNIILLSPVFAQVDTKPLDKYFVQALTDWQVPGMAVAIVKDGEIIFAKGYGVLEEGKNNKVDAHSMFAIASNTKAFVSASLAHLVWEEKISWDDKVVSHLPYFELYDAYSTHETTLRDILSHRVGLGTFSGDVIWYKSEDTAEEVIKRVKFVPQKYSYRAGFGYSNLMYITSGEVIKSVTGMPWDEFVERHFFAPLEMTRSVTSVSDLADLKNVASPHKTIDGKITPIPYAIWDNSGAAGGIISSVEDLSKWMILQMNSGINGADTLFSPKVQVDMWTPHNNYKVSLASQKNMPSKHFSGYGLGWGLSDYQGKKIVNHSGGYDGMYSRVTLIPDEKLGIVVLTNSMTGITTPITMKAIDVILGSGDRDWSTEALPRAKKFADYKKERVAKRVAAREPDTKPTLSLETYTGDYYDPMYGDAKVLIEDGHLVLDFARAPQLKSDLSHWHYNSFKLEWREVHAWFAFGTAQFVLNNNNEVTGIEFDVPNDDIFFDEIHFKKKN
ncbi:MAG: serine hydrolase [Bacteroidetes bacterium]|nr:MAG: serine hydrolase [Bacteroidota bacterium]